MPTGRRGPSKDEGRVPSSAGFSGARAPGPGTDWRTGPKVFTRRRLVAAAVDMFEKQGYEATTVEDIVGLAGTARATFYLHFSGKAEIVAELADGIWRDTGRMFAQFGDLPDWSHATIRGWLTRYVDAGDANKKALRLFADQLPQALRGQHADHMKAFVRLLTRPPERWAHFTSAEAERRAYLLINQLENFMSSWQSGRWARERSAMLDTLTAVWRNTLEADRAV
ncbi:hypothetical protein GCM10023205_82700 [Yinghuangia aomiensis]|uniref:HTH tetR-type domain-containing protein n=1 Tax=Yinghuangia aomiensis TaxID=676205 RepID=A0ABP9IFM0_9ACTN